MTDLRGWFDLITAALWLALAGVGIILRLRRSTRLHRIRLDGSADPLDAAYLASERWAAFLRLWVKIVFFIGALIALFDLNVLWPVWRIGVVLALFFLVQETNGIDRTRQRIGRSVTEAGG